MVSIFDQHQNIALQVSGGKDSLACLFLLRPYWDRLTVYWTNTGDPYPETVRVMGYVRQMVPNFVEIQGDQPAVVREFGIPSDLVPASHTQIGILGGHSDGPLIQDRYSCCTRTFMIPMQQRMLDDGVTLIIRGQKLADNLKSPLRSGDWEAGIQYLFPIEDWDDLDVMNFLEQEGVPLPRFYETMNSAPDCLSCSAYWDHNALPYLKKYHPEDAEEVERRLQIISVAVAPQIIHFYK